jgi:signal transduction histidine kinase/DNA-binding response OmpR family regulator
MRKPIAVLMIEDNEDDAELALRTLRSCGFDPEVSRAYTAAGLKGLLDRRDWDCVLCDYSLPGLGFDEAVRIIRARNVDIPLICVTGTIGEERTADLMRLGASDIVLKDHLLARLGPTLVRELALYAVRKQAASSAAALRESQQTLQGIADNLPGLVFQRIRHLDGTFTFPFFSGALADEFRLGPGATMEDLTALIVPADRVPYAEAIARSASELSPVSVELRMELPSKDFRWIRMQSRVRKLPDDRIIWDGVAIDVTHQKRTEERLALLQAASLAIAAAENFTAALGVVLKSICEATGWPYGEAWIASPAGTNLICGSIWYADEAKWRPKADYIRTLIMNPAVGRLGAAWTGKRPIHLDDPSETKKISGELHALVTSLGERATYFVPVCADDETLAVLLFSIVDVDSTDVQITDLIDAVAAQLGVALHRKRVEEALRDKLYVLESAQHFAKLGTWIANVVPERHLEGSEEVYQIHGVVPGQFDHRRESLLSMIHPEDRKAVNDAIEHTLRTGAPYDTEYRIIRPSGEVRWVHSRGRLEDTETHRGTRMVGVLQDTTEARQAQAQMVHVQKMEAVGRLAGGMAHDFNNILSIIIGNIDLLRVPGRPPAVVNELLLEARTAAYRGSELTKGLLAYARDGTLLVSRLDLNHVTGKIVKLLSRTLGEDIEVSWHPAPELWPVAADRAQLEAALTNIATNARDAMPGGGALTFRTKNRRIDATAASCDADLAVGDYSVIEISDTGAGMPPSVKNRIFEPFFTTKQPGKGTGLGLSMVYGFMKQSGGQITVYSEVGLGTTFRLYLPRAAPLEESVIEPVPVAPGKGDGETVLAVEDRADLRRVVARQLRELGYRVIEAGNAVAALAILDTEAIDLLFTDIVMPGPLNGIDLARRTAENWPSIRIVLTSGYSEIKFDPSELGPHVQLLAKPYSSDNLAMALRAALDA